MHMNIRQSLYLSGGLILTDILLPNRSPMGNWLWQDETNFGNKSGPGLADFSAKITLAGPILGDQFWYDNPNM